MMADLKKMAKEWIKADVERRFEISNNTILYNLLEAMAAEIEKLKNLIMTHKIRSSSSE